MIKKIFNKFLNFLDAPAHIPLRAKRYFVATSTVYFLGAVIHFGFLVFFAVVGAPEMMYFNIGSVIWFHFVIWVNRQGYLTTAVFLAFFEVYIHAAACSHFFGWESGFPYYALLFSTGAFILPPNKKVLKFVGIIIGALIFTGIYYYTKNNEPVYKWESPYIDIVNISNIIVSSLVHASFAFYFTLSANKAEDTIQELLQKEVERESKEKEFIKEMFGKAVDYRIRDYLLDNKEFQLGKNKEATVLFMDIRGFTNLSENKNPKEVVALLNRIFSRMNGAITENGGAVNKFMGDAIMALFNLPIELDNHADSALQAAIQMFRELEELNQELEKEGSKTLKIGIGIHTGIVTAGNVGSENRLEYTVIGDTVNTASRLESATKSTKTKLLISENTYQKIEDKSFLKYLGKIKLKGKEDIISVYALKD